MKMVVAGRAGVCADFAPIQQPGRRRVRRTKCMAGPAAGAPPCLPKEHRHAQFSGAALAAWRATPPEPPSPHWGPPLALGPRRIGALTRVLLLDRPPPHRGPVLVPFPRGAAAFGVSR